MNRLLIKQIHNEFLNFKNTGISFLETSHRSKIFSEFYEETNSTIKNYLGLPKDYKVLWIQNEREFQYDMIYYNYDKKKLPVYLYNEGHFSQKAVLPCNNNFLKFENGKDYTDSPYVFYVSDEGNNGFYNNLENYKGNNLISDMSDDFLTKNIDYDKHKLIFSSTFPHLGPNGIILTLINESKFNKSKENIPVLSQYENYIKHDSLYQTPSTHCIYFASKTFEFFDKYGINKEELMKLHNLRSTKIYNTWENNSNIELINHTNRSNSSILFKLKSSNNSDFIKKAELKGVYIDLLPNNYLKYINSIGKTEEDVSDFISLFKN